jgi:CHAT domain-containing protein/tetratricopeptide (TPR) repeat protein
MRINHLEACVAAFRRGDARPVLRPRAGRGAAALRRRNEFGVSSLAGLVYWCRYLAGPVDADETDRQAALQILRLPINWPSAAMWPIERHRYDQLKWLTAVRAEELMSTRRHRPELVDKAAQLWADVLRILPDDDPDRARAQINSGMTLTWRGDAEGSAEDLDEAVALCRRGVARIASDDPERPQALRELATALRGRIAHLNDPSDVDEHIDVLRQLVAATPAGDPTRPNRRMMLSAALERRYRATGALADLDQALDLARQAVAETPRGHADRAEFEFDVGYYARARFDRTRAAEDLAEALAASRTAVAAADRADLPHYLHNLSRALESAFSVAGDVACLTEAIDAGGRALSLARDQEDRAFYLLHQGRLHRTRAETTGSMTDLNLAVELGRQAVAAADPPGADDWVELAVSLGMRFHLRADVADIEEAIAAGREAVIRATDQHDRSICQSRLDQLLLYRFEHGGRSADVDEAVELARRALSATPPGAPPRANRLSQLAVALSKRHLRTSDPADADESITLAREAVAALRPGHEPSRYWLGLTDSLRAGFDRHPEPAARRAELDEAVDAARQAIATAIHPDDRHSAQVGLACALVLRSHNGGPPDDLDEAVGAGWAALDDVPSARHAARAWNILAELLLTRYERDEDEDDLVAALDLQAQTMAAPTAPGAIRLGAARLRALAIAVAADPASAVDAYTEAVELLPLLAWRGVSRADRGALLERHAARLASDAAACALEAGRPEHALRLLEQARAVVWSQLLDVRTDLDGLAAVAPELAAELARCRGVLDSSEPSTVDAAAAARRFDNLVAQVRALPPQPRFPQPSAFLRPPELDDLLPRLGDPPVVVLNVSQFRCDAIVLTHRRVSATLELDVTADEVSEAAAEHVEVLRAIEEMPFRTAERDLLERRLSRTLHWLWDEVAEPVLDLLEGEPRVCWCPTGPLTLLPLHAAGYHDGRRSVLDRIVSSYTPTVRALSVARRAVPDPAAAGLFMVSLAETPGAPVLPGTADERAIVSELLGPAVSVLADEAATHSAILAGMRGCRWLHAACHGHQNLQEPWSAGLLPYDWRRHGLIGLDDLVSHPGAEFAFLSACKTAAGGLHTADEAMTIAAALQYAGWRHVIGTLWSLSDGVAAQVSRGVYGRLVRDGVLYPDGAAAALHHTVRELREARPDQPSRWAPFIHSGP